MKDIIVMLISLGVILGGAELFTNGVEWLGKKLKLGAGAVGSVLAAVGTALPETMIPVIAFLGADGQEAVSEVGIGAILGAPFMLATLALFISGVAVLVFRRSNKPLNVSTEIIGHDIQFFLVVYSLAILASFLPTHSAKIVVAAILPLLYLIYVIRTVRKNHGSEDHGSIPALYVAKRSPNPSMNLVLGQIVLALLAIVLGAHGFVGAVQSVAIMTGIPAFVLSLIITPIATELPEKFNSVIWIGRGKDTLALGNITGAMVFQSSIIPVLGLVFTPWKLNQLALCSAVLALASGLTLYLFIRKRRAVYPVNLIACGGFYLIFIGVLLAFPQFR